MSDSNQDSLGHTVTLHGLPPQVLAEVKRAAPRRSMSDTVVQILREWAEDRAAIRAADSAEKRSAGKPRVRAQDLYKECGL